MSKASSRADLDEPQTNQVIQAVKVAVTEMAATWVARRALDFGFHRVTGHAPPTARDRDVPYRRIMAWAAVTAAAVAAANPVADRAALRPRAPQAPR
jgi:hypothetical protein